MDGVPIKIRVTGGKFRLVPLIPVDAIYPDRRKRVRPIPGGVSIGHPAVTAGTLGCRAIDKRNGEILGLSNNHIVALNWGNLSVGKRYDPTLQPGPYDGGTVKDDDAGVLERWEDVIIGEDNLIDAGVFYSDKLSKDIKEIGEPDQSIEPYIGMNAIKSGRTSGINYGKLVDAGATVMVGDDILGVAKFVNQVVFEPAMLYPGDSGSWIGDVDSFRSVALGYASSLNYSIGCRMSEVERILGIEVIPPMEYLKLTTMISPFAVGAVIANYRGGNKLAI